MNFTQDGDLVFFVSDEKVPRTLIKRLLAGESFHTHRGSIAMDDAIGQPFGSQIRTHLGHTYYLIRPTQEDFIKRLSRESQIIFPKDSGYIMMKLGIAPGKRVLEAGTGSGGLCLALASLVGDEGQVYSYDIRKDLQSVARSNLRKFGLEQRVTFKIRDAQLGFDEADLDAVFIDVREPWALLDQARAALRGGGVFGSIVPTTNQLITLVTALSRHTHYAFVEVEELVLRPYRVVPDRIRPDDQMIGHTGFLLFARAVFPAAGDEAKQAEADDQADAGDIEEEMG